MARGRRRAPRPLWKSGRAMAGYGFVTAALAGSIIVATLGEEVALVVDGKAMALRSTAGTVAEVLEQAEIPFGEHDYLYPAAHTPIGEATTIVVRHARPITLTVDGRTARHVVTATSVGGALDELAIEHGGSRLSAPRTGAIPLGGMAVTMFTPREVHVVAGERRLTTTTTSATVRGVLRQTRVRYGRGYRVTPALRSFPREGTTITVAPAGPAAPPRTIPIQADVARLNWAALAACESRGNPHAYNPSGPYYGLYQFSLPMWQAVGGAGMPHVWSAEEQTYRAQLLYLRVGGRWQGQWPHCGARLFG
ncbi:ubiquitin-like domain-containing protein [Nonomuraea sp. bgisy101]|uniref:resuscitation-promoting factor n=1 Tax=Nonomuraea sp. bgisy101 TaxID=3413784 RepID=UPI003D7169A6